MRRKEAGGTRHKRVKGWGSGRDGKAILAGWEQSRAQGHEEHAHLKG